jgi:hypothetical protein
VLFNRQRSSNKRRRTKKESFALDVIERDTIKAASIKRGEIKEKPPNCSILVSGLYRKIKQYDLIEE